MPPDTVSWFVISLRYVASLDAIDAAMRAHVAFLERQRAAGLFIVWGRKIPRDGGIILARGTSRGEIERIMREDPFVAQQLAEVEVAEFAPKPLHTVAAVARLIEGDGAGEARRGDRPVGRRPRAR